MKRLRDPRFLGIGLGLSLLVNMFLIGFVAARLSGPDLMPRREVSAGAEDGPPLRALLSRRRDAFRHSRHEVMQARHQVHDALVQEPYERARLERALTALQQATASAQSAFHASLLEMAGSLSVDERRRLSESRRLWRGDGKHPHGPPR